MDLVIDANILFAALIKKSVTSDILFRHRLYAPEFIFEEFKEYKEELKQKTQRTDEDFSQLLDLFERKVILIPKEEIDPFIKRAEKISPDQKDVLYIALALRLHASLWSNDKKLKEKQNEITVYTTTDLFEQM